MVVINFNKWLMIIENQDIWFIGPMDPNEGRRYIDPVKDEVVRGWDHVYNTSEYHIHPTTNWELGWHSVSFASYDSNDALENWQDWMHEVSLRKCGMITQPLRHVTTEIIKFPIYEGLWELYGFLEEFEEKVFEPQCLLELGEALKATPTCWWVVHK